MKYLDAITPTGCQNWIDDVGRVKDMGGFLVIVFTFIVFFQEKEETPTEKEKRQGPLANGNSTNTDAAAAATTTTVAAAGGIAECQASTACGRSAAASGHERGRAPQVHGGPGHHRRLHR